MFSKIVLLALSCLLFCRIDFQDEQMVIETNVEDSIFSFVGVEKVGCIEK